MKIITFLGTNNYFHTTYAHGGMTHLTELFPSALCHFLHPEELLVLVTQAARAKWLDELTAQVAPLGLSPVPVDIPDGHSVDDLWQIFMQLTAHLRDNDEVVFDITNSFRTLPFLTFLAASYLRVTRKVKLQGIYYGAWEARVPASTPPLSTDISPVFDLSPFINLLDLTTATDQFLKTGNAQSLAELLPSGSTLQTNLESVALGLHVLRPLDVLQKAEALPLVIAQSASIMQQSLPPFQALLERIAKDYGAFGLDRPLDPGHAADFLVRLLDVVGWYLRKGQTVQALALAREWLPTRLCCHFGLDPMRREDREAAEDLLNGRPQARSQTYVAGWRRITQHSALENLWSRLTRLRNDVLHCGFRNGGQSTATVLSDTQKLIGDLRSIAGQWK